MVATGTTDSRGDETRSGEWCPLCGGPGREVGQDQGTAVQQDWECRRCRVRWMGKPR